MPGTEPVMDQPQLALVFTPVTLVWPSTPLLCGANWSWKPTQIRLHRGTIGGDSVNTLFDSETLCAVGPAR